MFTKDHTLKKVALNFDTHMAMASFSLFGVESKLSGCNSFMVQIPASPERSRFSIRVWKDFVLCSWVVCQELSFSIKRFFPELPFCCGLQIVSLLLPAGILGIVLSSPRVPLTRSSWDDKVVKAKLHYICSKIPRLFWKCRGLYFIRVPHWDTSFFLSSCLTTSNGILV